MAAFTGLTARSATWRAASWTRRSPASARSGLQLALPGQELGLLALLAGLGAALLRLVLPGLLGLGEARLHLLSDLLHLLLAQRPLHRRQQLPLLVPGVLPERLLQLLELLGEGVIVLGQGVELGELGAQLLVVLDGVGD